MGQYGSDTVIREGMNLIIFDCFETLVALDGRRYAARIGVPSLLDHLSRLGKTLVVCSDGAAADVERALKQAGLLRFFAAIHSNEDACEQDANGLWHKRLDRVVTHHAAAAAETLFIGDSPSDAEAAQAHRVHFIRVPRSEDRSFTFARLIGGSSRYSSGVFFEHLMSDLGKAPSSDDD